MFAVEVSRGFVAHHWLTVPGAGPEGDRHAHQYEATARLEGPALDDHGFLVDIDDLRAAMDETVAHYRDETLNELHEFAGGNPSAERLAEQFAERLLGPLEAPLANRICVRIREDKDASVAFERSI